MSKYEYEICIQYGGYIWWSTGQNKKIMSLILSLKGQPAETHRYGIQVSAKCPGKEKCSLFMGNKLTVVCISEWMYLQHADIICKPGNSAHGTRTNLMTCHK